MKNISLIIVLLIFNQCGFKPIFLNQDINFKIGKIEFNQENKSIRNRLKNIENNNSKFIYDLEINLMDNKSTISKDSRGKPLLLRYNVELKLIVKENNQIVFNKIYKDDFDYQNLDKKFELKSYEEKIKEDILNQIVNKILIDLSSLK